MNKLKFEEYRRIDLWSIFFSGLSLILFILSLLIPSEQRLLIIILSVFSVIFAAIIFYVKEMNYNEKLIRKIIISLNKLSDELIERFNYIREISDIKKEIYMLKKKIGRAHV